MRRRRGRSLIGWCGEESEEKDSAILIDDSKETRDASEVHEGSRDVADTDPQIAEKWHRPRESGKSDTMSDKSLIRDPQTQDEDQEDGHHHHSTGRRECSKRDGVCGLSKEISYVWGEEGGEEERRGGGGRN
jgi:hypothetical protein